MANKEVLAGMDDVRGIIQASKASPNQIIRVRHCVNQFDNFIISFDWHGGGKVMSGYIGGGHGRGSVPNG